MTAQAISMKQFVNHVGVLGVHLFRRHSNGASYMLQDGRICSELYEDGEWRWFITEV